MLRFIDFKMDGCEHVDNQFEVRWRLFNHTHALFHYLFSVEHGHYVAFGLSGHAWWSEINGSDLWAAYYDGERVRVVDLHVIDVPLECSADRGKGICIDSGENDLTLTGWSEVQRRNRETMFEVSFLRKLDLEDEDLYDRRIKPGAAHSIVWAIGPTRLNEIDGTVAFLEPFRYTTSGDLTHLVDFSRGHNEATRCTGVELLLKNRTSNSSAETSVTVEFRPPPMPPTDFPALVPIRNHSHFVYPWPDLAPVKNWVFVVTLGPPGGSHGYMAITGREPADQVFYVNGHPAPELIVRRFTEYLFYTATGEQDALYITNDSTGGYKEFTEAERNDTLVLAGLDAEGKPAKGSLGARCVYTNTNSDFENVKTFQQFARQLRVICDPPGTVGVVHWTPNRETPDYVYYMVILFIFFQSNTSNCLNYFISSPMEDEMLDGEFKYKMKWTLFGNKKMNKMKKKLEILNIVKVNFLRSLEICEIIDKKIIINKQ